MCACACVCDGLRWLCPLGFVTLARRETVVMGVLLRYKSVMGVLEVNLGDIDSLGTLS